MRALVTGASGFIGRHLVDSLVRHGYEVCVLVRRTSRIAGLDGQGKRLVYGDVRDPASLPPAVAGVDIVYHLAGLTRAHNADEFRTVNEMGVANVAQACAAASQPPVLVVVSSLAAVGPSTDQRPKVESDLPAPVSNYGRSKLAGELAARRFAASVPLTIVRPPIVFGSGDVNLDNVARLVQQRGIHLVPGRAARRISIIHVEDLVEGMRLAGERGRRVPASVGEGVDAVGVYFMADDEIRPTYAELGQMMGRAFDRPVRVIHLPEPVAWVVASVADGVGRIRGRLSLLNRDKIREATAGCWTCSAERARTELNFRVAAPLDVRLREVAQWYRNLWRL
jgi:nucleoside-diphosphate-sugar epimerase